MSTSERKPGSPPAQHQDVQPGRKDEMVPRPEYEPRHVSGRLSDRVAIATGGDSGIGVAVAVAFAAEAAITRAASVAPEDGRSHAKRPPARRGWRRRACTHSPPECAAVAAR